MSIAPKTSTTADACACCAPCLEGTFSWRKRGSALVLCGFPEIVPSNPVRVYATKTLGGSFCIAGYNASGCSTRISKKYAELSGSQTIAQALGCASSGSFTIERWDNVVSAPSTTACSSADFNLHVTQHPSGAYKLEGGPSTTPMGFTDLADPLTADATQTDTRLRREITGVGCKLTDGFGGRASYDGTVWCEVSGTEDTEADALSRFQSGVSWGSWVTTWDSTYVARYEVRTGTTCVYFELQWRLEYSGLTPSTLYTVKVELYRRPFGSGSYTHYATIEDDFMTDGSGNLDAQGDVPNDAGYDTYAASGCVKI